MVLPRSDLRDMRLNSRENSAFQDQDQPRECKFEQRMAGWKDFFASETDENGVS
jgi:hypothetical protein